MGIETIALAATIASAGASIMGGMQQQSMAKQQAANARETALAQAAESGRVAAAQSFEQQKQTERDIARQKVLFLKGGVDLEGSPLLVMEETRRVGEQNAEEILKAGSAQGSAQIQAGENRALSAEAAGRQAFTSGLGNAFGSAASFAGSSAGQSLLGKKA